MRAILFSTLFVGCILSGTVTAQTAEEISWIQKRTDVKGLLNLSRTEDLKYRQLQIRLNQFVKNFGWQHRKLGENSKPLILTGISADNKPIYVEALDSQGNLTVRSNFLYSGGGLGLNLHGENMTAAVFDWSGINTAHMALENRATVKDGVFYSYNPSDIDDYHSTAVAGQIIGSGAYNSDYVDGNGFNWGQAIGIAHKANVDGYSLSNDASKASTAATNGLLVSNHSYGSLTIGPVANPSSFYDERAEAFDNIMHMAPYYLSVWAGGNNNNATATDRLNTHAVGKNSIAVAGVEEYTNYSGPGPVTRAVSSRGPADDWRVKPDIAAVGVRVRVPEANPTISLNEYKNTAGTSFAAPTVTGGVLLLQQHYKNLNGHFMLAATVKGVMLHTTFEAGPNPGPDIDFGWGLLNMERAANAITNNGRESLILEESLQNGGNYMKELVASGSEPLIATISWTDLKGIAVSDNDRRVQLVNDLDSRLTDSLTTFFPWKLDTANVTGPALRADNRRDNVERIEIANPVPGRVYNLTVNHKGTLVGGSQKFSLIVTGLQGCVANRTVSAPVNATSVDHQQASGTLIASNLVNSKGEAIYHAGDEVVLSDGFSAVDSSSFRAYIEGCTNDYQLRKGTNEREVVTFNNPPLTKVTNESQLPESAVYPNPGFGVFKVNLGTQETGDVQVTTTDGTLVFSENFQQKSELDVDLRKAKSGIYILRVATNDKVLTRKVIKK
jgi:hypothetical protein